MIDKLQELTVDEVAKVAGGEWDDMDWCGTPPRPTPYPWFNQSWLFQPEPSPWLTPIYFGGP